MNNTLKHLKEKEWSMGNGQCPECYGVPESWLGHINHLTFDTIGHKKDCVLVACLRELGEAPLIKGEFKGEAEYEVVFDKLPGTKYCIVGTKLKDEAKNED